MKKKSHLRHDLPNISKRQSDFIISRGLAYVKFRENKTLAKISEFTVIAS